MKLRYKIGTAVVLVLAVAVLSLALAISYTPDCAPAAATAAQSGTMKAVTHRCYGGPEVLEYGDVEKPVPAANELLVKVHAAAVNPLDWHFMRGSPYLMRLMSGIGVPANPRLGRDFAGIVEAVGSDVTLYQPGDRVFGGANGAFSQYVTIREGSALARMPEGTSFSEAAAIPIAAITALQALRDEGQLEKGQKVLINGASGGVGTYAVQIAQSMGAEVHGVCSGRNVELVRSLGAAHVFNYKEEDYTQSGEVYDLIIDNVGNHSARANTRVLKEGGTLVIVGGPAGDWLGPLTSSLSAAVTDPFVSQDFQGIMAVLNHEDLALLAELMGNGAVKSVIDRRYGLDEVAAAIAYSETGRARGKIVIEIPR